jgi:hypothetical protein
LVLAVTGIRKKKVRGVIKRNIGNNRIIEDYEMEKMVRL